MSLKGVIDNFLTFLGLDYSVSDENLPVFLHPYESANIIVMGYTVGYVGKIHPKVAAEFEIPKNTFVFELKLKYVPRDINENPLKEGYIYTYYLNKRPIIYKEIPKYPPVKRDLAFVIDVNLKVGNLIEDLKKASNLVKNIKLFDVYFLSNSRKSVAVSVEFYTLIKTYQMKR